jgi:hypothetical protein
MYWLSVYPRSVGAILSAAADGRVPDASSWDRRALARTAVAGRTGAGRPNDFLPSRIMGTTPSCRLVLAVTLAAVRLKCRWRSLGRPSGLVCVGRTSTPIGLAGHSR